MTTNSPQVIIVTNRYEQALYESGLGFPIGMSAMVFVLTVGLLHWVADKFISRIYYRHSNSMMLAIMAMAAGAAVLTFNHFMI